MCVRSNCSNPTWKAKYSLKLEKGETGLSAERWKWESRGGKGVGGGEEERHFGGVGVWVDCQESDGEMDVLPTRGRRHNCRYKPKSILF